MITITRGRDIPLAGAAQPKIVATPLPETVAVQPVDFRGVRPKPLVHEGDAVEVGTPVILDKNRDGVVWVSPASGTVKAVVRGEKRALLAVVIACDGKQTARQGNIVAPDEIASLSPSDIITRLKEFGLWPALRQRPFSHVADPNVRPKSIFVQAMNTEPLALDHDLIVGLDQIETFQTGLDLLKKLSDGNVFVCVSARSRSEVWNRLKRVHVERFDGPHPAGCVSTHIHHLDPIRKGDVVWYVHCQDVLRLARVFLQGRYDPSTVVAVTGPGVPENERVVKQTVVGAPAAFLAGGVHDGMRYISGSVLSGRDVGPDGHLGYFHTQLTVLPRGGRREFLGWLKPGFDKFSFSRMFLSALRRPAEVVLDTDLNGSERAIVLNDVYDRYVALDIMTFFLIKAILAGDIDEAERLGILECDEEDFALCSFACPSKTDVGGIIRRGLDMIYEEEHGSE